MTKKVLVLYGGVSTEHEVAIVTALQVMNALKEAGYQVRPGYISKEGEWYLGDDRFLKPEFYKDLGKVKRAGKKMILPANREIGVLSKGWAGFGGEMDQPEVIFPVFHGRNGEDGTMQGLLELANIPYVGCGVAASAAGMDKFIAKRVAESIGLLVARDVLVARCEWRKNKEQVWERLKQLQFPVFVKPANLGSTIGITKAANKEELENAIEVAMCYDQRVLVEVGIEQPKEVNISILGNGPFELSVTEEPIRSGPLLSFEDKYLKGGGKKAATPQTAYAGGQGMASLSRIMPARVSQKLIDEIEMATVRFFGAIGGKGIARIDYMLDKNDKLFLNEINTLPGSLAFYLWEKKGVSFKELVRRLVDLAIEDWEEKQKLIYTFESNILAGFSKNSAKGGKA